MNKPGWAARNELLRVARLARRFMEFLATRPGVVQVGSWSRLPRYARNTASALSSLLYRHQARTAPLCNERLSHDCTTSAANWSGLRSRRGKTIALNTGEFCSRNILHNVDVVDVEPTLLHTTIARVAESFSSHYCVSYTLLASLE